MSLDPIRTGEVCHPVKRRLDSPERGSAHTTPERLPTNSHTHRAWRPMQRSFKVSFAQRQSCSRPRPTSCQSAQKPSAPTRLAMPYCRRGSNTSITRTPAATRGSRARLCVLRRPNIRDGTSRPRAEAISLRRSPKIGAALVHRRRSDTPLIRVVDTNRCGVRWAAAPEQDAMRTRCAEDRRLLNAGNARRSSHPYPVPVFLPDPCLACVVDMSAFGSNGLTLNRRAPAKRARAESRSSPPEWAGT